MKLISETSYNRVPLDVIDYIIAVEIVYLGLDIVPILLFTNNTLEKQLCVQVQLITHT